MGIFLSEKERQTPHLMQHGKVISCKCDKFVPIVALSSSSDTNISRSAGDSAENT